MCFSHRFVYVGKRRLEMLESGCVVVVVTYENAHIERCEIIGNYRLSFGASAKAEIYIVNVVFCTNIAFVAASGT